MFKSGTPTPDNRHRRRPSGVPRGLSPHLMRSIGLTSWPGPASRHFGFSERQTGHTT